MKAKAFFAKYFWDIIVVGSLSLASSATAIYLAIPKNSSDHIAQIVRDSTTIETLDLSKESANERTFIIQGAVSGEAGQMVIGVKTNAIHIVSSKCPNQYCVHTGWISDAAHPIVCAYNHISITIVGSTGADVIV